MRNWRDGLLEIQVPARTPAAGATLAGPCCTASVGPVRSLGAPPGTGLNNRSRMSREVHVRFCERGGVRFPSATHLIITGRSKELLENEVKPLVANFLRVRGLELSQEKTRITHIEQGFDFLGHNVRRYRNGKFLSKPSRQGVISFLRRIRGLIKANRTATQAGLIATLNPLLGELLPARGRQTNLRAVDHRIWQAIWQWALRRHPKKGKLWVRRRYFSVHPRDSWWFATKLSGKKGERRELVKLRRIPITRHIKVRAEANPFDALWALYFERRDQRRMQETLDRWNWILWQRQRGRCLACGYPITPETGWHVHHVIWKVRGGSDRLDNLALLHPTCHRQVHRSEHPSPCRALQGALAG